MSYVFMITQWNMKLICLSESETNQHACFGGGITVTVQTGSIVYIVEDVPGLCAVYLINNHH